MTKTDNGTDENVMIAGIRQILSLCRAELDRPHTPEGDPDAQRGICRDMHLAGPDGNPINPPGEPLRLPAAITDMMPARASFFDGQLLRALDDGITQVVICGAGYDDRALRFRKTGVRYFELDRPYVVTDKAQRLEAMGADTSHLTLVGMDFAVTSVTDALLGAGHDPSVPTLFVAEHLLVFLPEPTAVRFVRGIRAAAAAGSRLAASVEVHPDHLSTEQVVTENNARFFGPASPPPMPLMRRRREHLAMLEEAGWQIERRDEIVGVFHTDLIDTQYVSATDGPVQELPSM
ncbi:class I SAM-dependent methyltransferase [Glaciibacter flavus]|uniref:class I SAM-dependent methyltransferase n=1 Tax=Orlajensenia flava TaxID=2565934 RepID=UPI003B000976